MTEINIKDPGYLSDLRDSAEAYSKAPTGATGSGSKTVYTFGPATSAHLGAIKVFADAPEALLALLDEVERLKDIEQAYMSAQARPLPDLTLAALEATEDRNPADVPYGPPTISVYDAQRIAKAVKSAILAPTAFSAK